MLPVTRSEVVALATAYDASYLWLARNLGVELVTLDRRLIAVAPPIRRAPG